MEMKMRITDNQHKTIKEDFVAEYPKISQLLLDRTLGNLSQEDNIFIPGVLHTVRPIALREIPVFTENCREYTLMHTAHFGKVVQVEVGAMLVGKIRNYHRRYSFSRGEEKGCFLYGGSTIIVLLQKNRVNIFPDIRKASLEGREVPVRLGQAVGEKLEIGCKKPE